MTNRNKSFVDIMIEEAMNYSNVTFIELHDQGGRYYDVTNQYEVMIKRVPEVETLLSTHYSEDLFYAFYGNLHEQHEHDLNVFCVVEKKECIVNLAMSELENGKINIVCFFRHSLYHSQKTPLEEWNEVKKIYPEFETTLLTYLSEHPAYRLHFATHEVKIVVQ